MMYWFINQDSKTDQVNHWQNTIDSSRTFGWGIYWFLTLTSLQISCPIWLLLWLIEHVGLQGFYYRVTQAKIGQFDGHQPLINWPISHPHLCTEWPLHHETPKMDVAISEIKWAALGASLTKHSYIYEFKFLVNSCETMASNIRDTIYALMQYTSSYWLHETGQRPVTRGAGGPHTHPCSGRTGFL